MLYTYVAAILDANMKHVWTHVYELHCILSLVAPTKAKQSTTLPFPASSKPYPHPEFIQSRHHITAQHNTSQPHPHSTPQHAAQASTSNSHPLSLSSRFPQSNSANATHLPQVRLDQRLAQLDVLLLRVGLRGALVDDLLPALALGLALLRVSLGARA